MTVSNARKQYALNEVLQHRIPIGKKKIYIVIKEFNGRIMYYNSTDSAWEDDFAIKKVTGYSSKRKAKYIAMLLRARVTFYYQFF